MAYVKGQPFKPQFIDPNTGLMLSAGTIEFYVGDTTTPTPYYTDSTGTVGGTSLELDAGGKPPTDIFFDTDIIYKLIVKNGAGTPIETLYPYSVNFDIATIGSFGAALSSVSEIRLTQLTGARSVQTLGYASAGDGGDGLYYADTNDTSTADDGFLCIVSDDGIRFKLQIDAKGIKAEQAGLTWDGTTDDTNRLQALVLAAGSTPILCPAGGCKFTSTIALERDTKFIGPDGAGGLFAGFSSYFTYSPTVVKSTIAGAHTDAVETLTLTSVTGFPSAGRVYIGSINGEWVSYTGISGNTLTGCTRLVGGGTIDAAAAYSGGETVWLNQPAFERASSAFSGTFKHVALYHNSFVDSDTGWNDLGLGLYFPQASYATVLEKSLVYGFEKGVYLGEAYVTTLIEPMLYRCRYACQLDVANGAVVASPDTGITGDASSSIDGWAYYFKDGNGALVQGGNLANGGLAYGAVSDSHQGLTIIGAYVEASNSDYVYAKNNGSIFIKSGYVKDTISLGRVDTGGKIFIESVEFENINNEHILNVDDTGCWKIENAIDIDGGHTIAADLVGIGTKRYEAPNIQDASELITNPRLSHVKAIPHSTATPLFKIRTDTPSADPSVFSGCTVEYTYGSEYSGGHTSEHGVLDVVINHRRTLAPTIAIAKAHSHQANLTNTLTLTFSIATASIGSNQYETTVSVTSSDSASAAGNIRLTISNSQPNRKDDAGFGTITML